MDRRQRKTKEAIFGAFTELLSEKRYGSITVGEIIERADIGRATFYAHFETKDFLLKELSHELFCHVFDLLKGKNDHHRHIFECNEGSFVFLHLFKHIEGNDNQLKMLLSFRNNELFLQYFKSGLKDLLADIDAIGREGIARALPREYWLEHIADAFIGTLRYWSVCAPDMSAEEINTLFLSALQINEP